MGRLFAVEIVYRGIFQKNLADEHQPGHRPRGPPGGKARHLLRALRRQPGAQRHPGQELRHRRHRRGTLEEGMAKYEPKEVDVTICVDDTLCKGVESWAWYGLQPINRLTVPGGTLHRDLARGPRRADSRWPTARTTPYQLAILKGNAQLLRPLGLQGRPHRRAHPGRHGQGPARAVQPGRGPAGHPRAEWNDELKAASALRAYERAEHRDGAAHAGQRRRSRTRSRCPSGRRCARASPSPPSPWATK